MSNIVEQTDLRNSEVGVRKKTYIYQLLSALIFIPLSIVLFSKDYHNVFYLLFLSEGLGQIFLALDNKFSLDKGFLKVEYFQKSKLGFLAYLMFSGALVGRLFIASLFFQEHQTTLLASGVVLYLIGLILFLIPHIRREIYIGTLFVIASVTLGVACLSSTEVYAAGINQFLYAGLLTIGVLFLKASTAEAINIFLWIHLFLVVGKFI